MNICRSYTGLGSEANTGKDTWLIYPGMDHAFTLYHPDKSGSTTVAMKNLPNRLELTVTDARKSSVYAIRMETKPARVWYGDVELKDSADYNFDNLKHRLTINMAAVKDGVLKVMY